MPTKTFYATRDLKNPSYGTRMLKAGDPVELDGPKSRLYLALGAVSPTKPKASGGTVSAPKPVVGETPGEQVRAAKPATPKKTTPRKRAKKRATAKK